MASNSQGIQQLLAAEKRAAEKVTKIKNILSPPQILGFIFT